MEVRDPPGGAIGGTVTFDRTERPFQAAVDVLAGVERDDSSPAWNQVHQALECSFHRVQVFIDIGMVEFDGGQDDRIWKIVEEFWAFVEECSVVLVAFQDEVAAFAKPETAAEIFCDAADQERWSQVCYLENPRQH